MGEKGYRTFEAADRFRMIKDAFDGVIEYAVLQFKPWDKF